MNLTEFGNFSFTFGISEKKVIYYKGNRRPYGLLTPDQQYDFLETHLQKISNFKTDIKWVYEFNAPTTFCEKRLHIHGFVINTCFEEMESFRAKFYGNPIQIAYSGYIKISDIQRTYRNIDYFVHYMNKNQYEIPYFMRVLEDKKHNNALDGKKFTVRVENNLNPHYINYLETGQDSPLLSDDYKFGKLNKFFVEY